MFYPGLRDRPRIVSAKPSNTLTAPASKMQSRASSAPLTNLDGAASEEALPACGHPDHVDSTSPPSDAVRLGKDNTAPTKEKSTIGQTSPSAMSISNIVIPTEEMSMAEALEEGPPAESDSIQTGETATPIAADDSTHSAEATALQSEAPTRTAQGPKRGPTNDNFPRKSYVPPVAPPPRVVKPGNSPQPPGYHKVKQEQDAPLPRPIPCEGRVVRESPGFTDLWAAILFTATWAGFLALLGYSIAAYVKDTRLFVKVVQGQPYSMHAADDSMAVVAFSKSRALKNIQRATVHILLMIMSALFLSWALSFAYLGLVRYLTKYAIWSSAVLAIGTCLGIGIFLTTQGQWIIGTVCLIVGVFVLFICAFWRTRVRHTNIMLRNAIAVSSTNGHPFAILMLGLTVLSIIAFLFALSAVPIIGHFSLACDLRLQNGHCSKAKFLGLLAFLFFLFYWTAEVIKGVVHVSIAGIFGSWYFRSNNHSQGFRNPSRASMYLAMTKCFPSICLGALFLSIIETLRAFCFLLSPIRRLYFQNCIIFAVVSVLRGFLWVLEVTLRFFNEHALSYVAIYGKAYVPAAIAVTKRLKNHPLGDVVASDCLVTSAFILGSFGVSNLCGILTSVCLQRLPPIDVGYTYVGNNDLLLILLAGYISWQICLTVVMPYRSAVVTLAVLSAMDEEVLRCNHPELFRELQTGSKSKKKTVGEKGGGA